MTGQRFRRQSGWVKSGFFLGLIGLVLMMLSGCVSSGKYEGMVKERDVALEEKGQLEEEKGQLLLIRSDLVGEQARLEEEKSNLISEQERLEEEKSNLISEKGRLGSLVAETEQQKQAAAMKAKKAQAEIDRQQKVYNNLRSTFAKEQKSNQVKIEMMKSGVKVNLANEILFPSGSSELNKMGVEVLSRAATQLKESPYQTVVAGFTDNQQISSKLQAKYPSNWELAGARAASVVRLLEKEGVASAQLIAISFGEYRPVASNDTPEGRSKNRRIEIILRPVPVTMD
jgi:chemotaxis protein MotB